MAGRLCDKYHNLMSWLKCGFTIRVMCPNNAEEDGLGRMPVSLIFRQSWVLSSSLAKHSFVAIGNESISTAILSLLLMLVGQLSFTAERMCAKYWFTALV